MTNQYKYNSIPTTKFKKSFKKLCKQKNFDDKELEKVIDLLRQDIPLDEKYHDHYLQPKNSLRD